MRLLRSLSFLVLVASALPTALAVVLLSRVHGALDAPVVAAVIASFALSGFLAALVARSVTRPLGEVVRGVLDIARGRFGREVPVRARNELGDLAYGFNHMSRELASYDAENRRLIAALEQGYLDTIRSLAAAVDAKDPYTRGHAERVATLSVEIGRELVLGPEALQALEYGGILHDIGKIGIPDAILVKAGPLAPAEMALVQGHPRIGAEIVAGVEFLSGRRPRDPEPPRAVGRHRLPRPARRRGDPARGTHREHRGHLGRLHLAPAIPGRDPRRRRRRDPRGARGLADGSGRARGAAEGPAPPRRARRHAAAARGVKPRGALRPCVSAWFA